MNRKFLVGIDLGGTNIKVGLFTTQLKLVTRGSVPTEATGGPDHVIGRIVEATVDMLARTSHDMKEVLAAGIGAPGPADLAEGVVASIPNMPGFENTPIKKMLSDKLGVPVIFENDANAACWGEFVAGAGKVSSDMALITLGTGIGGGIVSNGRLLHGFNDSAAEIGHTIIYPGDRLCGCGQRGCVEAYASANSTAARAMEALKAGKKSSLANVLTNRGKLTSRDVYEYLEAGDKLAKEIADGTAKALAILCVNLVHTTGPELILFTGGMTAAGEAIIGPIRKFFDELIWNSRKEHVRLALGSLGEDAGMYGAAALAREMGQAGRGAGGTKQKG
jgi:glucokinase